MIRWALLGDPVAHSLSPRIQEAALAFTGLDGSYEVRQVGEEGMRAALDEMKSGALQGANITMPHKRLAADLASSLHGAARRISAANTWVRHEAEVRGYSTDGAGIRYTIGHHALPADGPVLILGAGGAAAAALAELDTDRSVVVSARRRAQATLLCERLSSRAGTVEWGSPVSGALVINATPVGMSGESLPESVVKEAGGLFDMTYGGTMTPAVAMAGEMGLPACDGLSMLLGQAAESFRLWTERLVPIEVLRAAL